MVRLALRRVDALGAAERRYYNSRTADPGLSARVVIAWLLGVRCRARAPAPPHPRPIPSVPNTHPLARFCSEVLSGVGWVQVGGSCFGISEELFRSERVHAPATPR